MDNIQDLNQSPIEIENQENYSNYSSQDDQNFQPTDCETFKGSFLLEMEKMSRPLTFEKVRYNIYSLEYDQYQEHVLCFMDEQPHQLEIDFRQEIKEQQLEAYVLDFGQDALTECICNCHQKANRTNAKTFLQQKTEKQKNGISIRSEQKQCQEINEPKRKKSQFQQRKWASISLKQYKQQIKKKLQQRR